MPDFGIFRGFNDKLFGDKLYAGQLPINLGMVKSDFPDAILFFSRVSAAGGTLSATEQSAIITLVEQMKTNGIWDKMKAIYPMVGASAAACAQNLKSSSYTGTFNGVVTFASTGITSNGISGYMDTGIIPLLDLSLNNVHLSFYSRTNNVGNFSEMGANNGLNNRLQLTFKFATTNFNAMNNNVTQSSYSGTSSGLFAASRISPLQFKSFINGIPSTIISTSQNLSNKEIVLLATNNDGIKNQWSTRQCAFASIGDGLTDTEASNLYTAVQAFQTTLSRQV